MKIRCAWVSNDPLYIDYHDHEWGRPVYEEQKLFELLVLEGMQAGLSWLTVLKKREHFRQCFAHFDVERVALYGQDKFDMLLADSGIIRNRLKIQSIITNARVILKMKQQGDDFSSYIWSFVNGHR